MPVVSIDLTGADELERALVVRQTRVDESPTPVFTAIGEVWTQAFKENISDQHQVDGSDFAPLSAVTQALRTAAGYNADAPILRRGGDLWRSIQVLESTADALRVGTGLESARLLQEGGRTSSRSRIPNRPVPARPFVGLNDDLVEETLGMLSDWYAAAGEEGPADA